MKIDIEKLSEKELIQLNQRIVERLKFLESVRAHSEMMKFSVGEKVWFEPPGRERQFGTLVKYNKKTITVVTEKGEHWNVSPHLLSKAKNIESRQNKKGNVVQFKRR